MFYWNTTINGWHDTMHMCNGQLVRANTVCIKSYPQWVVLPSGSSYNLLLNTLTSESTSNGDILHF